MIRNEWYVALESKEVKGKPVGATRLGEKLVFWRNGHCRVHCAVDRCPHHGVRLSVGMVKDDHLHWPFHGSNAMPLASAYSSLRTVRRGSFRQHSGSVATRPTRRTATSGFGGARSCRPSSMRLPSSTISTNRFGTLRRKRWRAHYSRVLRSQLDVVHLTFVHRNTIGRGNRTLVEGPLVEWRDDRTLFVYVFNRADDGTPPRRASQLRPREARSPHLEFIMPNL